MKRMIALLFVVGCSAPQARTPQIDPKDPLPYAFEVTVDPQAERVVLRVPLDGDAPSEGALEAVQALVAPVSWSRGALFVDGKELVMRNSAEVGAMARQAIAAIRADAERVVMVSTRVLHIKKDQLSDLRHLGLTADGILCSRFERAPLARLVDAWSHEGAHFLAAPKLTVFAGQPGNLLIAQQLAYIQGYERDGRGYEPVIGIAQEGLSLKVVAAPNGLRKGELAVALSLETSSFLDPAPSTVMVTMENRTLEIPGTSNARVASRIAVVPGDSLLLVCRNPDARDVERPIMAVVVDVD